KKNVDFGGGLERLSAATLGNPDVFLIDIFDSARSVLETRSGKIYGSDAASTRSFRIILDHVRAATFMLATGIRPGNSEQGYVLRRLIRRSIREADKLGIKDAVLSDVAKDFSNVYADAYPFVQAAAAIIKDELEKEEAQFRKTLERALRKFNTSLKTVQDGKVLSTEFPATIAFELITTDGMPLELVVEEAHMRGMSVNEEVVQRLLKQHQEESRAGAAQKFAGGLADHAEQTVRYHTAHHLLLKALQKVLGPEVHQRGSNITSERLRIDFNYGAKMTDEQKREAERIVNEQIDAELPVIRSVMNKEDAEKLGAEHEFGANYPEQVSVYSVGPKDATEADPKFAQAYSIEFCGGPHVSNTRELGEGGKRFKIQKEEASSAGIRRIKAVLE
ncbi:MAG TPA: alanine--tRNA ligase-related protein, partial [Candidatus Paceibacterota bacterium]|nr:alanine--tRNA ligase-related protein [Candidatus Paceibacterota bacterium]